MHAGKNMKNKGIKNRLSLSILMTGVVVSIVTIILLTVLLVFIKLYESSMEQNSITSSEQAVVQVMNTVDSYTRDMEEIMQLIVDNMDQESAVQDEFFSNLMSIRSDVVSVTTYDENDTMLNYWSDQLEMKENIYQNLSFYDIEESEGMVISKPHVESLFKNYYPWVVTISQRTRNAQEEEILVCMDIRFSNIADYVDDVGIGQHGYCFIMDTEGNIIYHPQQQLIYSGLKDEKTGMLVDLKDGAYPKSSVIYTLHTLENSSWRIAGVCYVDEMITNKVENMYRICAVLLILALITALLAGILFSWIFGKPANRLAVAMGEFEKDAENFRFVPVSGTSEVMALSNSFGQMVVQVQQLMERVRQEEITLRKTELKALQAQINPHFLYNTLDSIAWMCEEDRNQEAVEMVNALARLFRISISKGKELIPLEKELQHAESYLKIQKFRYKNQFTYHFNVDPECLPYLCNKITLQPIIENAIYHGLDRMVDVGRIEIGIHQHEDGISMTVQDNGVGMTRQQCEDILYRDASDRIGIGIRNVHERIKIYFGKKYGLYITSELDQGTRVEIRIPRIEEGTYEVK